VERYEEVLKAIFFVKLLQIADLLGLADNVWRYITFACPDHLGGDGVVFACTAHAKTCFRILIYPAVFVYLGNQKLLFLHLLFEED